MVARCNVDTANIACKVCVVEPRFGLFFDSQTYQFSTPAERAAAGVLCTEVPKRCLAAYFIVVGARGFEPPTPWSRTRCATRLRYAPNKLGLSSPSFFACQTKIRALYFFGFALFNCSLIVGGDA